MKIIIIETYYNDYGHPRERVVAVEYSSIEQLKADIILDCDNYTFARMEYQRRLKEYEKAQDEKCNKLRSHNHNLQRSEKMLLELIELMEDMRPDHYEEKVESFRKNIRITREKIKEIESIDIGEKPVEPKRRFNFESDCEFYTLDEWFEQNKISV